MAGWTANDILGELTAVASLLGARTPPPDSAEAMMAAYDKLKRSVLASLCSKIGGMVVLDAAGALELMNAVFNSNLPDAAKIDLQEALDDKLNASSESANGASWGIQRDPRLCCSQRITSVCRTGSSSWILIPTCSGVPW